MVFSEDVLLFLFPDLYLQLVLPRFLLSPSLFFLWLLPLWLKASGLTCCVWIVLKPDLWVNIQAVMCFLIWCVHAFNQLAGGCGDLSVSALELQGWFYVYSSEYLVNMCCSLSVRFWQLCNTFDFSVYEIKKKTKKRGPGVGEVVGKWFLKG